MPKNEFLCDCAAVYQEAVDQVLAQMPGKEHKQPRTVTTITIITIITITITKHNDLPIYSTKNAVIANQ